MELEIYLPDWHYADNTGRTICCVVSPENLLAITDAHDIRHCIGLLLRQSDGARSAQPYTALFDYATNSYRVSRDFIELLQNIGADC